MNGSFYRFAVLNLAIIFLQLLDFGHCQGDACSGCLTNKHKVESLVEEFQLSSFPPTALSLASSSNLSRQCVYDSVLLAEHLVENTTDRWAWKMLESSGKLPSDGITGRESKFHANGLFDECLAVRAPNNQFAGQYCTLFFKLVSVNRSDDLIIYDDQQHMNKQDRIVTALLEMTGANFESLTRLGKPEVSKPDFMTALLFPSISLCLPSSCSSNDVLQSMAELVGHYIVSNRSIMTITDERFCSTNEGTLSSTIDGPAIVVLVTLSVLALLVLMATVHESWRMYRNELQHDDHQVMILKALHCFSLLSNGRKMLSTKKSVASSSDNLTCLHGIRVLTTLWVVLGHGVGKSVSTLLNPKMIGADSWTWWFQGISNATLSVDTFLLISGLLVSYLLLKELDRANGRFNVGLFYLHRYLRLTPVYAIILGFTATLMVYLGTGPTWYKVMMASYGCRVSWWKHLLYINNVLPSDFKYQCMPHTWYLTVDMHLFILSPLFVYLLWRWKRVGLVSLAGFTLASLGAAYVLYIMFDFPPTLLFSNNGMLDLSESSLKFMFYYYFQFPTRAPPHLIGILLGWSLHVNKGPTTQLPRVVVALLWTVSFAIFLAAIYGLVPYIDEGLFKVPKMIKLTYGPLHRTGWALALSWVIFACSRGYGGFVNSFLSWRVFIPLGRLSFCVYLIHYDYLTVHFAMFRIPVYYTFYQQVITFLGISVCLFGLAFFISVTLEASFMNLEKLIFIRRDLNNGPSDKVSDAHESNEVAAAKSTSDANGTELMQLLPQKNILPHQRNGETHLL